MVDNKSTSLLISFFLIQEYDYFLIDGRADYIDFVVNVILKQPRIWLLRTKELDNFYLDVISLDFIKYRSSKLE